MSSYEKMEIPGEKGIKYSSSSGEFNEMNDKKYQNSNQESNYYEETSDFEDLNNHNKSTENYSLFLYIFIILFY